MVRERRLGPLVPPDSECTVKWQVNHFWIESGSYWSWCIDCKAVSIR